MPGKILVGRKSRFSFDGRCLGQFFFENADKFPNNISQIDAQTDEKETFASVKLRSIRCAIEMRKKGVGKNDNILFCSKNTLDNVIPMLAAIYLGAKVASIDPMLSARDCKHAITLIQPKFIFVEEDSIHLVEDSASLLVVFGKSDKYLQFSELQKESLLENEFKPISVDPKETALIFFSSGTTGLPKGICINHYSIQKSTFILIESSKKNISSVFHMTTFYWISAFIQLVVSYQLGASRILGRNLDGQKLMTIFQNYKVNHCILAPIITYLITNLPNIESFDTSNLHYFCTGGTPISADQMYKTRKVLKHTLVTLAYGQTESSGCIAYFDEEEDADLIIRKPTSSGKVSRDTTLKIVDVTTRDVLGPNQKGEICYKSDHMMNGYYNMDTSSVFDEDGFLLTGDIGYYDLDECMYVIDRIKEMFKYKSWHVVPATIEAILKEHPDVEECAVFGIAHEIDEYHPAACVKLCKDSFATPEVLYNFVSEKVSDYSNLRGGIQIVDAMLKTPSGKVQRNRMRDIFLKNL